MAASALRTGGGSCLTSCLMELGCCCWEVRGRSAVVFFFLPPRDDDVDGCWEAVSTTSSSSLAQYVETAEASHLRITHFLRYTSPQLTPSLQLGQEGFLFNNEQQTKYHFITNFVEYVRQVRALSSQQATNLF